MTSQLDFLNQRITNGETWLTANTPDHPRHRANVMKLWELIYERDMLLCDTERRQDGLIVTLQLPPGVQYQKPDGSEIVDTIRVLFRGEATGPNEITLDALREANETVRLANEALISTKRR